LLRHIPDELILAVVGAGVDWKDDAAKKNKKMRERETLHQMNLGSSCLPAALAPPMMKKPTPLKGPFFPPLLEWHSFPASLWSPR
jgi:hypothetical protein